MLVGALEAGLAGVDDEILRGDDVGEGVGLLRVGGVVPGAPDDVAVGAIAGLVLACAEEVEGLAVELAGLNVLDELRNLRLEAIGELVGGGGFGVELIDEALTSGESSRSVSTAFL